MRQAATNQTVSSLPQVLEAFFSSYRNLHNERQDSSSLHREILRNLEGGISKEKPRSLASPIVETGEITFAPRCFPISQMILADTLSIFLVAIFSIQN
jgi:hypothetical protein